MKSTAVQELTKDDLLAIARKWQEKLKVNSNRIQVMKMKKKWSSCSTKGNITLNSDLTKLPKEIAEYAILHEILHLIVPNHGKTFKALLSVYMPDWEALHNKLARTFKKERGEACTTQNPYRHKNTNRRF